MKLLQELLILREAEEDTNQQPPTVAKPVDLKQKLQDLFSAADSAGNLQPYIKTEVVQAKPANPGDHVHVNFPGVPTKTVATKEGDFLVRLGDNPNTVNILPKGEFEKTYELEKADSQPDGEGYLTYRPKGQLLAFQYNEHEPLTLKDEHGHTVHVKFGDYLGYPTEDATTLVQLDKNHFEKVYRLAD